LVNFQDFLAECHEKLRSNEMIVYKSSPDHNNNKAVNYNDFYKSKPRNSHSEEWLAPMNTLKVALSLKKIFTDRHITQGVFANRVLNGISREKLNDLLTEPKRWQFCSYAEKKKYHEIQQWSRDSPRYRNCGQARQRSTAQA
jgi:hypothetical protein